MDVKLSQLEFIATVFKLFFLDSIIASDLLRAKQTAQIVAKKLKLKVTSHKNLREIDFGLFNGKPAMPAKPFYSNLLGGRKGMGKSGETYQDVLKRVYSFFKKIDKKYKDKTILLVSHQCPLWILQNKVEGFSLAHGIKHMPKEKRIGRGELRELN